jgi:beta-glucanase (GH16 family)
MILLSFLFLVFSGCEEETPAPVLLPANLVVSITPSTTVEGRVDVTATAANANYYGFEFFYDGGSNLIENPEGKANYQFAKSGTYKIVVRAHATFDKFITYEDSVTVTVTQVVTGLPATGYTTPLSYAGYNLVWQDEFNGTALGTDWVQEIGTGNGGWGNNELQYYRAENTEVRDGVLIITAKQENFGGRQYTSSRIKTQGKKSFKYGRIDIRAVLPKGKGLWPATWMLGTNITSVGWPACGEIDIMEMVGGPSATEGDKTIHGTVHWADANGNRAQFGGSSTLSSGIYADEWHVFSIVWDSQKIIWYRDDIKYHEINTTPSTLSEFQEEFFFIFNVAVGGDWPGSPNATTQFPQRMAVDYVRVFQK